MRSLRSAAAILFAVLALTACAIAPPRETTPPPLLLLSIDALRADQLDLGLTPNLNRIAREGVRAAWMNPSYPALTFPNHYTLVTGLRPDRHGVVHNTMRDAVLGTGNKTTANDGRWYADGEPLWVTVERAGLPSATMYWPGSGAEIRGFRPQRWFDFATALPIDVRVDNVIGWLSEPLATRPRFVTLYFEKLDKAGHDFGPDSPQAHAALRELDAAIGRLLATLATRDLLDRINLVLVSDHGMATSHAGQVIAVEDMVDTAIADVISVGQSIGIAPHSGSEAAVEKQLLGVHDHYDCWGKQQLPPRWKYGAHPRVPPIVCQMHEGWDALWRKDVARHSTASGSHGYDPALPSMRAIFLARGPAFRRDVRLPAFDNVDVYPLLARLIGVVPTENDGDIAPLLPALK